MTERFDHVNYKEQNLLGYKPMDKAPRMAPTFEQNAPIGDDESIKEFFSTISPRQLRPHLIRL